MCMFYISTFTVGDGFMVEGEGQLLLSMRMASSTAFIDGAVDGVEESGRERRAVLVVLV